MPIEKHQKMPIEKYNTSYSSTLQATDVKRIMDIINLSTYTFKMEHDMIFLGKWKICKFKIIEIYMFLPFISAANRMIQLYLQQWAIGHMYLISLSPYMQVKKEGIPIRQIMDHLQLMDLLDLLN